MDLNGNAHGWLAAACLKPLGLGADRLKATSAELLDEGPGRCAGRRRTTTPETNDLETLPPPTPNCPHTGPSVSWP